MKFDVFKMVKMGVLCALAIVLIIPLRFPIIPAANFLVYDPADVPILIGTFMFGPVAGLIMTAIVAVLQGILLNPDGGWVGIVMHFIATGTFVVVAGLVYKKFRTFGGAILALVLGSISMALITIPANLFFTVRFYGYPYAAVKGLLLPAIIPFNLLKAAINSIVTAILYKPLSRFFKAEKYLKAKNA
jgi:riboflavin transporter FmnP